MMQHTAIIEVDQHFLDTLANKSMMQGGGVVTALFTIAYGLMWLRRRISSDKLEADKNRSEGHLLEIVIKERDTAMQEARDAWAQARKDAETIGKLSAEVEGLRELNNKTNNEVNLLRILHEKQSQEIAALRETINSMRAQIPSCVNCPLRRMKIEADT